MILRSVCWFGLMQLTPLFDIPILFGVGVSCDSILVGMYGLCTFSHNRFLLLRSATDVAGEMYK